MSQSGSDVHVRPSCHGPALAASHESSVQTSPRTPARLCKPRWVYASGPLQMRRLELPRTGVRRRLGVSPYINRGVLVPSISQEK